MEDFHINRACFAEDLTLGKTIIAARALAGRARGHQLPQERPLGAHMP